VKTLLAIAIAGLLFAIGAGMVFVVEAFLLPTLGPNGIVFGMLFIFVVVFARMMLE
jgi:hypothetical protein